MAVFGLLSLQVLLPRQFARVCHSVNMEWVLKENHVALIALHNSGKSTLETEDRVPKAEHTDPIKSCLIREDLDMRARLHSKETPPYSCFEGDVTDKSRASSPVAH
jgi:hypothetical protein